MKVHATAGEAPLSEPGRISPVILPEHGFEGQLEHLGSRETVRDHVNAMTSVLLIDRARCPLPEVDGFETGLPPLPQAARL